MNDDDLYPTLPPDVKAAADAVKDGRVQTRLAYAEDLVTGQIVVVERPCQYERANPFAGLLVPPHEHEHGVEERTILEVRTGGDVVSMILLDENGEQKSLVEHRLSTVRVAVNR
jgi:hypothetical protein